MIRSEIKILKKLYGFCITFLFTVEGQSDQNQQIVFELLGGRNRSLG